MHYKINKRKFNFLFHKFNQCRAPEYLSRLRLIERKILKLEFNFNQSSVIPYRRQNGEIEILLITSIKKKKWIIPKGYVEFNLSAFESAKKEAMEEAGVLGTNETIELGAYESHKQMGNRHIKVFAMEVTKILDDYPDKPVRKRKWVKAQEAAQIIDIPEVSSMLLSLINKIK